MNRRAALVLLVALAASACGRLGVGTPGCESLVRDPGTAIIMSLQAVPTAKYAPCLNELKFGWDDPAFKARSGLAETRITADFSTFLTVSLTESCDVGSATRVPSGREDIERFEDVVSVQPEVRILIVPATDGAPLDYARGVVRQEEDTVVADRPLRFRINVDFDAPVLSRVDGAFLENDFVWIVNELDAQEATLEMRQSADEEPIRGLSVAEALRAMDEVVPKVVFRGNWYFTFEGGCITYEFDADGRLAETMAEDVESAIGFYPLDVLRGIGVDLGYEVVAPDEG